MPKEPRKQGSRKTRSKGTEILNTHEPSTQALGYGWNQYFSKCDPHTSLFSFTWEPGRHANSWASPQTCQIRNSEVPASNLCLDKPPGDSDAPSSLKTTGYIHSLTHRFLLRPIWCQAHEDRHGDYAGEQDRHAPSPHGVQILVTDKQMCSLQRTK